MAQLLAAVAFPDYAAFFKELRCTIGAVPDTVFTADTLILIVLYRSILGIVHGTGGAALDTFGLSTVIASRRVIETIRSWINTGFKISYPTI